MRDTLNSARRAWKGLLIWFLLCVSVAVGYVALATPQFVATTQVVLEPRQPSARVDPALSSTAPTLDSAQADSQVQVLQSERNLRFVFDTLGLASDPDFAGGDFNPLAWLQTSIARVFPSPTLSPADQAKREHEISYRNFADRVGVKRLAQSYAFEVSFRALNPQKAARIANSITVAYIRDQVVYNVGAEAAQRGGDFLQNRIAESKTEAEVATEAVKSGIVPNYVFGHADARIVSAAVEPLTKSYPMTTLALALAALFSLVSGFGALFVREGLDPKIRSRAQLKSLSGIEPIVVIPLVRHSGGPSSPTSTLALDVPDSAFAHALRALRGFVLSTVGTSRVVSIGILPCNRGTGASLVAGNLAHLIAAAGRDVTLIDADLRASSLTIQLAPQTQFGLAEMANNTESNPIDPQQRLTPNLSFIASRGVNSKLDPNQFIGSRETLLAIAGLTESRDLIVDLASLSVSADAIAIGRSLTGVVVVAALGSTTTDELVELIRTLAASGVRVLGVVLNKASSS